MTISYPLSMPSTTGHSSIRWIERNVIGVSESPLSLKQQIYDWNADKWGLIVSVDPTDREEAAIWSSFLSALRGKRGTFSYGDLLTRLPQGAAGGTPLVNGASAKGDYTIATDGWPVSTLVLKANDRIQIDTSLYKVLTDATTNSSGEVTLDIWPSSRGHANNASIITEDAKGIFRLSDNEVITDDEDRNQLWNISFEAEEAL